MGKFTLLFIILFLAIGCKEDSVPVTHYSNERLVGVMVDLYIASAAIKDVDDIYRDSLTALYRSQISEIHQVDIDKVELDIATLQKHPKVYKELHSVVSDSIVMMEKNMPSASNRDKNRKK